MTDAIIHSEQYWIGFDAGIAHQKEIEKNLRVIDEILHASDGSVILEEIKQLRKELQPLIEFFTMLPQAIESNPMMKMLLGKMTK